LPYLFAVIPVNVPAADSRSSQGKRVLPTALAASLAFHLIRANALAERNSTLHLFRGSGKAEPPMSRKLHVTNPGDLINSDASSGVARGCGKVRAVRIVPSGSTDSAKPVTGPLPGGFGDRSGVGSRGGQFHIPRERRATDG
jgi:hypothetical protein